MSAERLLVVDDSPLILRVLTMILTKAGYAVETATNGEEALEKARRLQPPLIFLDAMMPKKDGYQVARELRESRELARQPYIIMLTALDTPVEHDMARAAGVDEVMVKPFSPAQVTERVSRVLGREQAA